MKVVHIAIHVELEGQGDHVLLAGERDREAHVARIGLRRIAELHPDRELARALWEHLNELDDRYPAGPPAPAWFPPI